MRLFCFPYAGGTAAVYRDFKALLPGIEVHAVEFPGHGPRLGEPVLDSMDALVDALLRELHGRFDQPFALYGHSMGAAVAYELARRLPATALAHLRHLFLSAGRAPQHIDRVRPWYQLSDEALLHILRELGGTPQQVLDNRELMVKLVIPMLRADFAVFECYRPPGPGVVPADITAFAGNDDERAPPAMVADWYQRTSGAFTLHVVAGDHFFPWRALPLVAGVLKERLAAAVAAGAPA